MIKCLNPFNKIDIGRMAEDTSLVDDDLLTFRKDSDGTNRKITLANLAATITTKIINVIVPAGVVVPWLSDTTPQGWVMLTGGTIGSANSGGTTRANSDTAALYSILWYTFSNTELPIQDSAGNPTTRGANAAADFAANKRLPVPDLRGRAWFGLDNMGGEAANRITTAGSGIDGAIPGATGGSQTHTLTETELPPHTHDTDVPTIIEESAATGSDVSTVDTTAPVTSTSSGGGDPHNNMPPAFMGWYIAKL